MTTTSGAVGHEPSLGRDARKGTWTELGEGTFAAAHRAAVDGRWSDAGALMRACILEAEELHDVYDRWPRTALDWMRANGAVETQIGAGLTRLAELLDQNGRLGVWGAGITVNWPRFVAAAHRAEALCRGHAASAGAAIDEAHAVWMNVHDSAVDLVAGVVDLAVRLVGERHLGGLWDHLMRDWYDAHERRYSLDNQSWDESTRQLAVAIFDGFHAHLTGPDRSGAVEVIEEQERIGFRFAPCGSGGRTLATGITGGSPRSAPPFSFAVTTEPHDWAWNKVGVCSYCVHCCLLNEVTPIDRLGYPTRVIDAPTWPSTDTNPSCTWWIYRHPSLVPDEVYTRVGRTPERRPMREGESR